MRFHQVLAFTAHLGTIAVAVGCNSEAPPGARPDNIENNPTGNENGGGAGTAAHEAGGGAGTRDDGTGGSSASNSEGRAGGAGRASGGSGGDLGTGGKIEGSGGTTLATSAEADSGTPSADGSSPEGTGGTTSLAPGSTYTTSCETQKCAADEVCVEGGFGGTYCARPCPGQRLCPSGTSYCERNGGVICGPK